MIILYILFGLIIGSLSIYFILRPKLKVTASVNEKIQTENVKLNQQNKELLSIYQEQKEKITAATEQRNALLAEQKNIQQSLEQLKELKTKAAQDFYEQALEIAENSYDKEITRINTDLTSWRNDAQQVYLDVLADCVQDYQQEIQKQENKLAELNSQLITEEKVVTAAVAAAQRKLEMEKKQDYYRICLSPEDITEIKCLRTVLPQLRDKTPLNKVIYKVYYEKPLTDMIGRVVGPTVRTGIYKITDIETQMCYVGQAVDIASRWKQHTKRGVGAEDWTQNKLYPAMYSKGVENFTFEIIEDCDRAQLNEREDFWQEYFKARSFGYSIK